MFEAYLSGVRKQKPHIHCITNYVSANDCANILLACGASPIMADCPEESEEITALCDGLLLSTGILNPQKLSAMLKSGKTANRLQHPVVLDPVGAGASEFRTASIRQLLNEVHVDVIRGNLSEIKALFCRSGSSHGVDAVVSDSITKENLRERLALIKQAAHEQDCVIVATGRIDIVANNNYHCFCIHNGCSMMRSVTGAGCQLSALTAAFITANPQSVFEAAAAASCAMGVCGEIAFENLLPAEGNATYGNRIIDAVYQLDENKFVKRAKIERK